MAIPAMVEAMTGTAGSYAFEGNVWSQSVALGAMTTFVEINGDFYWATNAYWDGAAWQRVDESKIAWMIQQNVTQNMVYEGYPATSYWVCQPDDNPIGDWAAVGGWEMVYSYSRYRDFTVGGGGTEYDGHGTVTQFGYGRFQHATVGGVAKTSIMNNVFLDESGRDTPAKPSWQAGFVSDGTTDYFHIARAPGGGSIAWADLVTLSSAGVVFIKNGTAPGSNPSGGVYLYAEGGALKVRGSSGTVTTIAPA